MNILIQMVHPAHYYYYKNVIANLKKNGHRIVIAITTKDLLETLVRDSGLQYVNIQPVSHKRTKIGFIWDMMLREIRMVKLCIKHRIQLLTGSTVEVSTVAWLLHRFEINIGEDDATVVHKYIKTIAPFVQTRLTPDTCDNGRIEYKSVHYSGFLKLAYLHPKVFSPDVNVLRKYIDDSKTFFLLRFSSLKAYHDEGIKGISAFVAQRIVNILSPYGQIFITSERELEPQFEKYRLNINPLDIHHVLAFAKLYIGDSQSMAVEAAMLGVPSLRFNDFAGKIGVLEELEHKYELTLGIPSSEPQRLYDKVQELLEMPNLREVFQTRRQKMLSDKIDVTAFFTWFIENYPESRKIMKENPDYQYRFK